MAQYWGSPARGPPGDRAGMELKQGCTLTSTAIEQGLELSPTRCSSCAGHLAVGSVANSNRSPRDRATRARASPGVLCGTAGGVVRPTRRSALETGPGSGKAVPPSRTSGNLVVSETFHQEKFELQSHSDFWCMRCCAGREELFGLWREKWRFLKWGCVEWTGVSVVAETEWT